MSSFLVALNAVVPFLFYISFGYIVRSTGIIDRSLMEKLNHMIFRAFFPIMMFYNIYSRDPEIEINPRVVITGVSGVILLTLIMFLLIPGIVRENKKRGVLIQALSRSNFLLFAVPLIENIFGKEGVTVASMMVIFTTPLYNILAIIVLEYFRGSKVSIAVLFKNVLTNPVIMGAIAGFICVRLGIILPGCIEKPVSQFAAMTTPLALFVLGGTILFSSMRSNMRYIIPTLLAKLIAIPAVSLIIILMMDFAPLERFVIFTVFATPVAAASGSMAASLGGDADLAGELIVTSTVASVITIFLWIFLLKSTGLI